MLNFKFMKVKIKIKFFWEFKVFSCQRQNAACTLIVQDTGKRNRIWSFFQNGASKVPHYNLYLKADDGEVVLISESGKYLVFIEHPRYILRIQVPKYK